MDLVLIPGLNVEVVIALFLVFQVSSLLAQHDLDVAVADPRRSRS